MLIDSYDRVVDYLRVSVTERCNFRCQYCMPEKPFSWVPKENLLSFEELFEFIKIVFNLFQSLFKYFFGTITFIIFFCFFMFCF